MRLMGLLADARRWPDAYAAYTSRGLTVRSGIAEDTDEDHGLQLLGQHISDRPVVVKAFADGRDEDAIRLLQPLWDMKLESSFYTILLRECPTNLVQICIFLFEGQPDRIRRIAAWLKSCPALDLSPSLRNEAARNTMTAANPGWLTKAYQGRTMDKWVQFFDATESLSAPLPEIVRQMRLIDDRYKIYARGRLGLDPKHWERILDRFNGVEDQRSKLINSLDAMEHHAETGAWPDGFDPATMIISIDSE